MNDDEPVLLHTEGHILHITLNRPRALNALTHTMVRRIGKRSPWRPTTTRSPP